MSDTNAQLVTTAYQRIFGDLDSSAVDDYVSNDFVQHNPTIPDGPSGIKKLIEKLTLQGVSKQTIEFKHVIEQDDIVILHSRYEMGGREWRFIDIYRVDHGKLVEHWDAMMQMPDTRANNNPMF